MAKSTIVLWIFLGIVLGGGAYLGLNWIFHSPIIGTMGGCATFALIIIVGNFSWAAEVRDQIQDKVEMEERLKNYTDKK